MFNLFKKKKFEPKFPVIELCASSEEVLSTLSTFSDVKEVRDAEEKGIDFAFVAENECTSIHVGFKDNEIAYVNYLTDQFNRTENQKAAKLNWFLEYYGSKEEYEEPNDTGYMIFFHNPKRNLSIVFGLHMGPIRVNNHANA